MLLIYSALSMGGIETFYVRLAKERYLQKKKTILLILSSKKKCDGHLISEAEKYADIFFLKDCLLFPWLSFLPSHFFLLIPLKPLFFKKIFLAVNQVHVSSSIFALFALKALRLVGIDLPITIGVYHSKEFLWASKMSTIPFFEKINRNIFTAIRRQRGIIFFNDRLPEVYSQDYGDGRDDNIFPLGVISDTQEISPNNYTKPLKICSVGRLVQFKSYNLWMIDLVNKLRTMDIAVSYEIFGEGPLEEKIRNKIDQHKLQSCVVLKGNLPYSEFSDVVKKFDIFVGSGTALIEASNLGVPSIVGIESLIEPYTYGFVANLPGFSYHEDGLFEKQECIKLILDYLAWSVDEKNQCRVQHVEWAKRFSMKNCVSNFDLLSSRVLPINDNLYSSNFFHLRYTCSLFVFDCFCRARGRRLSDLIYK